MVEITAGGGINGPGRSRRPQMRAPKFVDAQPPQLAMTSSRPALAAPEQPVISTRAGVDTSAANNAAIVGLTTDMSRLTSMVSQLAQQINREKSPQIPEELFEEYMLLVNNQVERELAEEVIKELHRTLRPDHLGQKQFVRDKIAEQLERRLPTAGPIARSKTTGPHVVALIGPTGVGKTTTIAKLAAKLKLEEKRKVGLITIDTYRIAAIDQLRKFADIISCNLHVVASPEDLRSAVAAMSDCDFVLIDTAGRSPKDTLKLNELKTFLDAAAPDEVHLVLSTTASRECAELAIERFADVRIDKLIFTKLDEANACGNVLNVVRAVKKPLSYVTTGQDVPADIEVARGRRVAQLILGSEL
jgi:flagellar biosynthesis protein FlhF